MQAKNIMTKELFTLSPHHHVDLAKDILDFKRIRHIPIVDGDVLVGILSHRDLLRAAISNLSPASMNLQKKLDQKIEVSQLMNPKPITVTQDCDIKTVASLMRDNNISCVCVVDGANKLKGIITEADFLTLAFEKKIV